MELGDTPFKRGQEVHRQRSGQKGGAGTCAVAPGLTELQCIQGTKGRASGALFPETGNRGGGREGHDHPAPDRSCYGFRSYSQEAIGQGSGAVYLGHVPPPPRLSPTSFHFGSQKTYWRKVKVVQTGDVESISHLTNE